MGFYYMKLTNEKKIELYKERQNGKTHISLSKKYDFSESECRYLVCLIKRHGVDILDRDTKTYYTNEFKEMLVNKVLVENHTMHALSLEYGLKNSGILKNWVFQYKKKEYTCVSLKQGKITMPQKPKKDNNLTRLEQLEKEVEYLRAENEYLKKLDALVRKNRAEEQKKQK